MSKHVEEGPFRANDKVAVERGRKWWGASIGADLGDGQYEIYWDDHDWPLTGRDVVSGDRIRWRHEVKVFNPIRRTVIVWSIILLLCAVISGGFMLAEGRWQPFGPASGTVQEEAGQYEAGQQVQVEWEGNWYEGTILEVRGRDAYFIRYNNFDESWNEVVGSDRLRHR
jgi:hypothetical protein